MYNDLNRKIAVIVFEENNKIDSKEKYKALIKKLAHSSFECKYEYDNHTNNTIIIKIYNINYRERFSNWFNDYKKNNIKQNELDNMIKFIEKLYSKYYADLAHYITSKFDNKEPSEFDYTSILKLIGLLSVNKVDFKSKEEMLEWYKINHIKVNNYFKREQIFDNNQEQTEIYVLNILELLGYYSNNEIYLCYENIENTITKFMNCAELKNDWDELLLIKKVFYHEIGHLIFDKINILNESIGRQISRNLKEKQANYIASCATNGEIDYQIKQFTVIQGGYYNFPLLSSRFYIFENLTKNNNLIEYKLIVDDYKEEVMKLYRGYVDE